MPLTVQQLPFWQVVAPLRQARSHPPQLKASERRSRQRALDLAPQRVSPLGQTHFPDFLPVAVQTEPYLQAGP
jgi:hypothetical protein